MSSSTGSTTSSPRPRAAADSRKGRRLAWRGLACLALVLVGCRTAPVEAEGALLALIEAAASGERPDPHGWVEPADPARAAAFLELEKWVNVNAEAVT